MGSRGVVLMGLLVSGIMPGLAGAQSARPVPVEEPEDPEPDEAEGHDLGGRNAEERPASAPKALQGEAREAVPDEEDQHEVARPEPILEPAPDPEQRGHAEQARDRLVQEQRVEMLADGRRGVAAGWAGHRTAMSLARLDAT